jgi:hypothetical protein
LGDMTWSYSRITAYEDCKYKFFLSYLQGLKGEDMFFANYGIFVHDILGKYLSGDMKKSELGIHYLLNFKDSVIGRAPSSSIFNNYFEQGLNYLDNIDFPYDKSQIVVVEKKENFSLDDKRFVGILDCVVNDNDELVIVDHKSRSLKQRSKRGKITQTDIELDNYLRQLYIYSIPVHNTFGKYPSRLEFNCFRNNEIISEPFKTDTFNDVKKWALDLIDEIENNEKWNPNLEFWKCSHLCELHNECEYFQANWG